MFLSRFLNLTHKWETLCLLLLCISSGFELLRMCQWWIKMTANEIKQNENRKVAIVAAKIPCIHSQFYVVDFPFSVDLPFSHWKRLTVLIHIRCMPFSFSLLFDVIKFSTFPLFCILIWLWFPLRSCFKVWNFNSEKSNSHMNIWFVNEETWRNEKNEPFGNFSDAFIKWKQAKRNR